MASAIYPKGKEQMLQGGINMSTADIRFILVDTADYTYSAAHEFLSDVAAAGRVAVTASGVGSKTFTDGVFDAADITFSSVTGDVSEALIIYAHTGTEGTSRLIAYLDSATGLPVTPNGGNITVTWDSGANKIFKL